MQIDPKSAHTVHGYPILDRKPARAAGSEIVLCLRVDYEFDRFVIWRMDTACGTCEGGQYIETLARAVEAFGERS